MEQEEDVSTEEDEELLKLEEAIYREVTEHIRIRKLVASLPPLPPPDQVESPPPPRREVPSSSSSPQQPFVSPLIWKALRTYGPDIESWIAKPPATRKPLLVHGPLQSGKKTLLKIVFDKKKYDLIEPSPRDNLDEYRDGALFGKTAYLMDVRVFGSKKLPKVSRAPQIFVTHAPYAIATKADLEKRFQVMEVKTGFDAAKDIRVKSDERDSATNYWQAVDIIRRREFDPDECLRACDMAGEFLGEIVYRSYAAKNSLSPEQLSRTSEYLSQVDLFRRHLPTDLVRLMDTVVPLRQCRLDSRDLKLVMAVLPASERLPAKVGQGFSVLGDGSGQPKKRPSKRRKKSG